MDTKLSYIESVKSYPENIEARHVRHTDHQTMKVGFVSMELNNSMILLPEKPMKRRYFDERVGWFTTSQTDYGIDNQEAKTIKYLDRWRLEVKDKDIEKFKAGELVEPKKTNCLLYRSGNTKKMEKIFKTRHRGLASCI